MEESDYVSESGLKYVIPQQQPYYIIRQRCDGQVGVTPFVSSGGRA